MAIGRVRLDSVVTLTTTLMLISCASSAPRSGTDFTKGTVSLVSTANGVEQLQIRLGSSDCRRPSGSVAIDTPAVGLVDAATRELVLQGPIEVVHGVNGEVRFDFGDVGDYGRAATFTFARATGSTVWGEYRATFRGDSGLVWAGSFVLQRCR